MKRIPILLIALMLISTIGTAEAKSTKKKTKAVTTIDRTNTADADEKKPASRFDRSRKQSDGNPDVGVGKPGPIPFGKPGELQLKRADSAHFDLRSLPHTKPIEQERAELPDPAFHPVTIEGIPESPSPSRPLGPITPQAAAPPPINVFEGLDRFNWGAGSPPDTNGDVGPNDYIQTVNTSIGVFDKSTGAPKAEFTFNTFMSQGHFGNLCDTNNFGDPVVLYDTFENRWIITDFAFLTDISGNVLAPAYQCFAASMSGDPVSGGWNFYSIQISDALNDYPKFGIWPDGLYMSANLFTFGAGSTFKNARAWAFNKAQMYAGSPTVKVVTFDIGGGDFTVIPSNARLQTGTPPPGRPNLFASTELFLNALAIYKFHVDWDHISLSTFTGPDTPLASTSWPNQSVINAGQPGTAMQLDVLQIRAMVQNQYTNFGGTESLWLPHTVRRAVNGVAAPRWYQTDVTGGTVGAALPQGTTWDPDAANNTNRFMPSVALDRAGNMAMGYSVSSAVNEPIVTSPPTSCATCLNIFPSIRYAGRLAGDPVNTFSQTEQTFFTGTASQTGINRWGDYSSVTLDPDGCTFWLTNEYANPADQTFNHRWLTKFGNFGPFPGCVPAGAGGTISGTVTTNPGGSPIPGATVMLGANSTATDGSGNYSFSVPAGTYPSMSASKAGFASASASSILVTDGNTTTQNFSLTAAPPSACITDTTQADFQAGVPSTTVDLNASPGDIVLSNAPSVDQLNTAGTTTGTGFGTPAWCGQTFIAAVNGQLVGADVTLFCNGCGATPPNLTLSVRATSGGLPTGADLATATIPGSAFASGASVTFTGSFGSPATLTSGTQYALVLRPVSAPAGSGYFWIRSSPSTYANGSRVLSADSGATWSADSTRDYNFKTYMQTGYRPAGTFVSSPKDANPAGGITPIWQTFSWNAATPANTSLQFQLAGSNNVNGPFNFVGPDGTAGTFFTTSPVQLSPQFYNLRYMEYKAFLGSTNGAVTPALNDATFCFNDVDCSGTQATITPSSSTVCVNSTGNTASGPAGMTTYAWGIANGTITSATNIQNITYTAGASGTVTLTLTVTAPNGCIVSGSQPVTIDPPPATPTITPGGPTTFTYPGTVTLNSSAATGYQWNLGGSPIGGATNQAYVASASGNYTVVVTDGFGCSSAASSITTVTVNPATPVVTATGGTFAYNGNPHPGTGSATGGAGETLTFTLSYTGTGATTYGPTATAPTLVGTYNVVAHTNGDANNTAGDSAPAAININKANPVVTATGGTFTYDGNAKAGSGTATGGGGESLTVTLTYNGTGATTYGPTATAPSLAGTYTVTAHTTGDANNNAGDSSATALTINKFNPLMAAHGGTFTYNGAPEIATGQAFGGAGEILPVTLTYQGISGTVWGPTATPPTNAGVYLATAHTVGDANNNAEDSLPNAIRINKATPTISVTAYCVNFDGSPHTAPGTATGVLSESLAGLVLTGTTHTAAGTYLGDPWIFTDSTGNYNNANGAVNDSIVNATITAPVGVGIGSTGNVASVANAGTGATYAWAITNGTITAGTGTNSITFSAGAFGTLTLQITVTTSTSCASTKSANVAVGTPVTVTSVSPVSGSINGHTAVTVNGSGFQSGAAVTFGGSAATSIVVVSGIKITAITPAHAAGAVNVTVTNTDTSTGTLTNGYTYAELFDANGDHTIDPSDIFYLISYLFLHGPPPVGGVAAGDANGDGVVDPADIFYLVNYLFLGG
ncbi:MAG TPA: carboxypeptidase regulatory-like domain-containing protein, partial [Vicinamibacterales bacterium]